MVTRKLGVDPEPPKAKLPITKSNLRQMAIIMNPMSFIDVRDTFLFNLMFTGMLRESEVIAPRYKDVVLHTGPTGLLFLSVFVEMSKTDQARVGDSSH